MKKMTPLTRQHIALFLVFTLVAGLLPLQTGTVSRAAGYGISNPRTTNGVTTWDCVWFGNYWQEDTNGDGTADKNDTKTPIKWRVLSVDGDDAFLLADQNLDCQQYNDIYTSVTWETCTMRSWLNAADGFLGNAFTAEEQSAIKTTNVVNEDNPDPEYKTKGGNDTVDKVYLLSLGEVTDPVYGFAHSMDALEVREALNTAYARAQGAWTCQVIENFGSGIWWLRTPGYNNSNTIWVNEYGHSDTMGNSANCGYVAVRPALHLNLSAVSNLSYADTVSATGGEEETPTPTPEEGEDPTPAPVGGEATENPVSSSTPVNGNSSDPVSSTSPAEQNKQNTDSQVTSASVNQVTTSSVTTKAETKSIRTVSGLKVKIKKKKAAVTWKKVTGAKGYQICYSTSKKFKKKKQKLVKKNKITLKKLKPGKTYYVRVRAYTMSGSKKVYGKWSKVVKRKCKR